MTLAVSSATTFGSVFPGYQLGGITGVWLGGVLSGRFAGQDQIGYPAIALGALCALAHFFAHARPAPAAAIG